MADCQAFCVYDPVHEVIGLIHCGWRCILARVIPHSIELMKREWHTDPTDLLVGSAPSLCKSCSEFTDPRKELPGFPPDLIDGRCADLREAAERQFDASGVPRGSIERLEDCTRCHPEKYWTYRGGYKTEVLQGIENALVCTLN
jgi:copper oxidase (laccase) domain-containing protein